MIKEIRKTVDPLPKQQELLDSEAKETLMSGAWGSSKSFAICCAVVREAILYPESQILLCRKTFTSLKRSTLQTLIHGDNPVLPRNTYKYNKIDQKLTLNGTKSVIYLLGIDDIVKVRSMNLSYIAVDECSELEENEWQELIGRLRNEHGTRRIIGATNPSGPTHWLYKRFFADTKPSRKVITSTTLDNPYLPADYIQSLKEMPKQLYDRFVLGQWIAFENAIYPEYNKERHLRHRNHGEFNSYMLGVDFGFTNPTALCLLGIDGDNNIHLIEEQKESKLLIGGIVDLAERYHRLEPIVIVDPSAPALIAEFEKAGFKVKKADNSVDSGIARFQNYLHKGKFSAEPNCVEFIKEVESYIRDEKGKPVKINDHILDAIRYCLNDLVEEDITYERPRIIVDEGEDDEF